MKEPPMMLSEKDLLYVEDLLNVTISIAKKIKEYELRVEDEVIVETLNGVKEILKKQYNTLMGVIS